MGRIANNTREGGYSGRSNELQPRSIAAGFRLSALVTRRSISISIN